MLNGWLAEKDDIGMTDEAKQQVYEVGIKIAERVGVPVAILAALLFLVREAASSLHSSVLIPVVQSHTEFLSTTQETLKELGNAQRQQAETLQELAIGQRDIHRAIFESRKNSQ